MVGVAAAGTGHEGLLVTGMAGLVAGAMSMAAGEYVSVRSRPTPSRRTSRGSAPSSAAQPGVEKQELARSTSTGARPELAAQVAEQLMAHDALAAHARDELGISPHDARPVQAALPPPPASPPAPHCPSSSRSPSPARVVPILIAASVVMLAALGALAARVGRAPVLPASLRVALLGAMAMAVTAGIGRLFGAVV